jgi:hypothetical protein
LANNSQQFVDDGGNDRPSTSSSSIIRTPILPEDVEFLQIVKVISNFLNLFLQKLSQIIRFY